MSDKCLEIGLRISINSGTALLLWIGCFFGLLMMVKGSPAVATAFPVAVTALTGAFGGYLIKRNSNNKITLESQRVTEETDARKITSDFYTTTFDSSGGRVRVPIDASTGQQKD